MQHRLQHGSLSAKGACHARCSGKFNMPLICTDVLTDWVSDIFQANGVTIDAARTVAEHLVDADACGVSSHGTIRVPQYVQALEQRRVIPDAKLTVVRESAATAVLHRGPGFGHGLGPA